jgi:peptidoglycan/LPS O-acetylase OafA/YrhL
VRTWPARYEMLDGLRGIACLGVLVHHLGGPLIGHYAVMVFFVISGYCITASAQSCLRHGIGFGAYMKRRLHRIYPPYFIAVMFFAATRVLKAMLGGPPWHPGALQWLQNLTLTQWVSLLFHPAAWPASNETLFVAAFWSLNYEEQFYLVVGLALLLCRRYGIGIFHTVVALTAAALLWNFTVPGGWLTGFFLEYWAHFALGSCLYFVLCEPPRRHASTIFVAGCLLLAAYCAVHIWPWTVGIELETQRRAYIELMLLAGLSVALLLLRPYSAMVSRSLLWRPIAAVGTISYSLYLIHQFNLKLVETLAAFIVRVETPTTVLMLVKILLHIGIASGFWYLCERPFLNRRPANHSLNAAVTAAAGAPVSPN